MSGYRPTDLHEGLRTVTPLVRLMPRYAVLSPVFQFTQIETNIHDHGVGDGARSRSSRMPGSSEEIDRDVCSVSSLKWVIGW